MHNKSPFKNINPDELYYILQKIEISFNISFYHNEINNVKTIGDLCNIIIGKVQGQESNNCTTQQAFYKLRNTISIALETRGSHIFPGTRLEDILPENGRRQKIAELEAILGFKIHILRKRSWLVVTLSIIFVVSLALIFFYWQPGLAGLLLSIAGFIKVSKYNNVLIVHTVGQLAKKLSREHYFKVRRNPSTVNKSEIAEKVKEIFCFDLKLKEDDIKSDTPICFD